MTESLQEKWSPILEHPEVPEIKDSYRKAVTTVILENQERALQEDAAMLAEAAPLTNPPALYIVQGSESFIAINPLMLSAVGPVYQQNGSLIDVRQIYITGSTIPIYVNDSYTTVKAAIDAL